MYERLLVPVDGSRISIQGLEEAIKLSRQLKTSIRLIHVLDDVAEYIVRHVPVPVLLVRG